MFAITILGTQTFAATFQESKVTEFDIPHMVLVFQASRVKELWDHRGFHTEFKRGPGNPSNVLMKGYVEL